MTQGHDEVDYELQYLSNNYIISLGKFYTLPEPQNSKLGIVPISNLVT